MRTYSLTVPLEERTLTMRTYIAEKYHDTMATLKPKIEELS